MTTSLQSLLDTGAKLLGAGRLDEARDLASMLLQQHQGTPAVHLYAADTASMRGERKEAIACLQSLPAEGPGSATVLLRKAQLLFLDSQRAAALEAARAASARMDPDVWQFRSLARLLSDCNDLPGAKAALERGLEILPPNTKMLHDLAVVEFQLNLPEEAARHIDAILEIDPFHSGALQLRSSLRTQTPEQNHIDDLRSRLEKAAENQTLVAAASYALAKEHEDLKQYEESFAALQRGARTYRSTLNYDLAADLESHEGIRKQFTRREFEALTGGYKDENPVFIVGMPRTGTTLVERMLSSHSGVVSIGEFPDFPLMLSDMLQQAYADKPDIESGVELSLSLDFMNLGRRYTEAARQIAGEGKRFVDKLPYNFLYCGYILAALPNAKIVHLSRHPLDTCYAVYKTRFFNAYSFSYDLDELADYYVSYRRHMAHWHDVLPGRILDVSYENLVTEPEAQARRILEWCGLPWEAEVLDFYKLESPSQTASAMQVRKPVYTDSIGAWQRAGSGIDSIRERLLKEGLLDVDAT